jgi:hypothetical protein
VRRLRTAIVVTTAVALLGTAGTVLAYADGWTIPDGKATITTRVAKMPGGVKPSVAKQAKSAVVSWSAQEIAPNVRMDQYVVTAHSVSDPPLPDVTRTVTASGGTNESVTFTATQVAGGKWYWTIVPKFRNWTGQESGKSQRLTFPALSKAEAAAEAAKEAASLDAAVDAAVAPAPAVAPSSSGPAATPVDPPSTQTEPPAESKPSSESKPAPAEPKEPPAADQPAPTTDDTTTPPAEPAAMGSGATTIPG